MIIFKRKHLSIKWGIFAGILVFLAILLLLLFLLQTVYLDDIYKAAKKNTLNNANDKVEQVLGKSKRYRAAAFLQTGRKKWRRFYRRNRRRHSA